MQTAMTNMMAAVQTVALAAVTDFVEYAKTNGVDIPADMVSEFFANQGVKTTKTGRISKASVKTTGRGTGRKSPGKQTALFNYLNEPVGDGKRRDEFKRIMGDEDLREDHIAELEDYFADDAKQAEKCASLRAWFDEHTLGEKGAPSQVVNKFGGLMWAKLGPVRQAEYKAAAKAANEALVAEEPEPVVEANPGLKEAETETVLAEVDRLMESGEYDTALEAEVAETDDDESDVELDDDLPRSCATDDCESTPADNMDKCPACIAAELAPKKTSRKDKVAAKRAARKARQTSE